MTDRIYRTIAGLLLLIGLFFDSAILIYALVVMMLFEGITNLRIPKLVCKIRNCVSSRNTPMEYVPETGNVNYRFNFEAERMWRLVVACLLFVTFYFYEHLWFFPWFMGFAIFGAGISGVCPVLLAIRWVGFK